MKIRNYIIIIFLVHLFSLISSMPIIVYGEHPYVGGYFNGNTVKAYDVIMAVNFPLLFLDIIPENEWIGGVLSVAGGHPDVTGHVYQAGIVVDSSGTVYWAPQIWLGNNLKWYFSKNVGEYNYITWYVEIYGLKMDMLTLKYLFMIHL